MKLLTIYMLLHSGFNTITVDLDQVADMNPSLEGEHITMPIYGPVRGCVLTLHNGSYVYTNESCETITELWRNHKDLFSK